MTPDEMLAQLANLAGIMEALDRVDPAEWSRDPALTVWDRLDLLATATRDVARKHGVILARTLPDEYNHPEVGVVHTEVDSNTKWDGDAVLSALSKPMVDQETGEKDVPAIPTADLRKVLPAVKQGNTSSKWNRTGLTAVGLNPGLYSSTDYGGKVLRRGPRYRR